MERLNFANLSLATDAHGFAQINRAGTDVPILRRE